MTTPPAARTLSGVARLFGRLLARPLWPALALLAVTVLALWQATRLQVEVNLSGLIGPQTEGARAIVAYEDRFAPLRAEEVLLLRAPSFADEQVLTAFEDLILELQFVDGVEQVISLAGLPAPGRAGAWLTGPELADLPPEERLRTMRDTDPLAAQLISPDLTATAVVVVPAEGQGGDALAQRVVRAAAPFEAFRVSMVGLLAVQRAIAAELIHDLEVLTPSAVVLCLLVSLLLFRTWRAVAVIALPPIAGVAWFFGWMGAAGIAIDPVMGALPVLLIVLAFSDAIHVYHAGIHALDGSEDAGQRVRHLARAAAETAPAAVLTSLTTIIAFASLSLPDSPSLNTMSYTGIVGMVLCLVSVLLMTPVLMALLGVPRPGTREPRLFAAVVPPALRVARMGRIIPGIAGVVLVGFWVLQSGSNMGFRYGDYLPRGAEVSLALADMEEAGLGSDRMLVIVEADPADPLARVQAAAGAVWGPAGEAWARGPGGESMLPRMAARDGSAHALPTNLPIAARGGQRADAALTALQARLAAVGLTGHTRIIGPGQALLTEGPRLVVNLRLGLYVTIGVITLLVALVYRSVRLALAALVVNVIPILGVEAWLVVLGRELTIMNVIALTVAFGIAVDDTLHFLNRLRLAPDGPIETRVTRALTEAGPPMAATSGIILAGLVVTLASSLPGLAIYGGLIALAVALALVADLFLLPGLIRWSLR